MTDLADFLLARIAEDEEWARPASGILGMHPDWHGAEVLHERGINRADSQFIARHDPARVLAECDAKRRIVEVHALVPATDIWGEQTGGLGCAVCDERADLTCGGYEIESSGGCATLRVLVLPYADHDGYDEAWKP